MAIRIGEARDAARVLEIDTLTWAPWNSPAPRPIPEAIDHHRARLRAGEVLVAEVEGRVCGYLGMHTPFPVPSNAHVAVIDVAVHPACQRQGIATALIAAAPERARHLGKSKLSLRVLSTNPGAHRLYLRAGFAEEGRLRGEFRIAGASVDDILMAKWI
jgi:ribosomal protein S18 acetylase RimI-like enzyme